MNKKVSFFIGRLGGGGAHGVCITIANGLADKVQDIDIVVLRKKNGIRTEKLSDKVHLVDLQKKHARSSVFSIWRYLACYKPDVVLSFNRQLSVIIGIIRYISRINFKLISRNIIFLSIAEKQKRKLGIWHGTISNIFIKKFYKLSDLFIAQCYAMKEDLSVYLRINPQRIIVIHNPVNKNIENYIKNVSAADYKKDYLLCAGRLESQKAFHYVIEAFVRISDNYPNLRLKILGQGSLEAQLKQLANNMDIVDKVDFEGYQEDIIPYYVQARLTVLTSLFEGFPNVLIESIALGTPVVSFDCPSGPSEIIQDGVNGYLVKYQDMEHLIECLRHALDREWDAKTVMATADRFSSEKIIDEYEKVLT